MDYSWTSGKVLLGGADSSHGSGIRGSFESLPYALNHCRWGLSVSSGGYYPRGLVSLAHPRNLSDHRQLWEQWAIESVIDNLEVTLP